MTRVSVPQEVIERDHTLEGGASRATEALARHRWHWTLDESNRDRVSIREYARAVGVSDVAVRQHAAGYAAWVLSDHLAPLSDAIARAAVSVEKEAVTDAVAKARGLTFQTVHRTRPIEVKRVREMARDAAERKGTTVQEEAPAIARMIAKAEVREVERRDEREERLGLRYIELESHLVSALRDLAKAQRLAGEIKWDVEEKELLSHTVNQIRELLHLIDARIAGVKKLDWDAELASIMEGVAS